ncbi:regulatory LuxR family protein [Antricoccus suffuscus]|uniref:Regulatory LuxR family protein n=1 Tax=Antricoccus suffuscus TaxID=1629062 RepID=A0A2T0ZU72_9ACTN|nr:helix-turn-helix transcriptional regulator [Antricoccus suffuscus]PRZ39638.1 regulatory LuxR family protein [Antricoccus suffuscus]
MSAAPASVTRTRRDVDLHEWARHRPAGGTDFDNHDAIRELSRRHAAASARDQQLLGGRAALDRLLTEPEPDPALLVQQVTALSVLRARLTQLADRTGRELLSLHAGEPPSAEAFNAALPADRALLARGVRLRIVYPVEFAQLSRVRTYTTTICADGAQVQFTDAVPYRMIISDGARAVVPIVRDRRSDGAIITTEPALVIGLRHLAWGLFRSGRELKQIDPAAPSGRPTQIELAVIRVMSEGLTDEAACKRLAVSERTFRRHVAQLLERLGATSRFQAGIRAVERGWL